MSATKYFVHKAINWEKIKYRLNKFKSISQCYKFDKLKSYENQSPYFCHYMGWILGVWENEKQIEFIDSLLEKSSKLTHWKSEKPLLDDPDFKTFYGLIWQMQIAYWLLNNNKIKNLKWNEKGGPDLIFEYQNQIYYLECYSFMKSYVLDLFLEEILNTINENLRIEHQLFLKHSLPNNNDRQDFFDTILNSVIEFNKRTISILPRKNPEIIYQSKEKNITIYYLDNSLENYDPSVLPMGGGDKMSFTKQMLNEAIASKNKSNDLKNCRPNILAINFLIGTDLQLINNFSLYDNNDVDINKSSNIDNIYIFTCGIDKIPNKSYTNIKGNLKIEI